MKLDTTALRYLTNEDWRVLTAVEIGSKNHEVVPTPLIIQFSHVRSGSGVHKSISTLAKANLIARTKNAKYDGYRLTYGGLDYLALHTHLKSSTLYSTGNCIGVGKESDIYVCAPPPLPLSRTPSSPTPTTTPIPPPSSTTAQPQQVILKIHRLGRISFRTIKTNRDYLGRHRTSASWMYMSRLSAQKEFVVMKALGEAGFPVPRAIAQSRHTVVMGMVGDGVPLRSVRRLGKDYGFREGEEGEQEEEEEAEEQSRKTSGRHSDPAAVGALYASLIALIVSLAEHGLIHGDFNEFNILLSPPSSSNSNEPTITLIDFPQTLSISHPNAAFYFDRDVNCIKTFFARRFGFRSSQPGPFLADVVGGGGGGGDDGGGGVGGDKGGKGGVMKKRLDVEVEAAGFSRKMGKELEKYMKEVGVDGDRAGEGSGVRDDDEGDEDESDENEDEGGEDEQRVDESPKGGEQDVSAQDSMKGLNALSIQNG